MSKKTGCCGDKKCHCNDCKMEVRVNDDDMKIFYVFRESLEVDEKILLAILKKSLIKKLIDLLIGNVNKPMTISKALKVRYVYCAYRILAIEFGDKFAARWFFRPSIYLKYKTPMFVLRNHDVKKLGLIITATMACVSISRGVLP